MNVLAVLSTVDDCWLLHADIAPTCSSQFKLFVTATPTSLNDATQSIMPVSSTVRGNEQYLIDFLGVMLRRVVGC
jgi:hypothetical protein